MVEFDLREKEVQKRTMHIFVNGIQQKPFGTHIPPSPQFAVHMNPPNGSMIFESYSQVEEALHKQIEGEESLIPVK